MIKTTIEFTCDTCGVSESRHDFALHKVTGFLGYSIRNLKKLGWAFEWNEQNELTRTSCNVCAKKWKNAVPKEVTSEIK